MKAKTSKQLKAKTSKQLEVGVSKQFIVWYRENSHKKWKTTATPWATRSDAAGYARNCYKNWLTSIVTVNIPVIAPKGVKLEDIDPYTLGFFGCAGYENYNVKTFRPVDAIEEGGK